MTDSSPAPDLTDCDREPIHVPGHIQPHGVLIATHPGSGRISHVSANLEASTGLAPGDVLNAELERVLGPAASAAVARALESASYAPANVLSLTLPIALSPNRSALVHRHLGRTIIELEAAAAASTPDVSMSRAQNMIGALSRGQTVEQLCQIAVREIRRLAGYDRVMVYQFNDEGGGAVVAEDRAETLEPYLDLRYPASDIPTQARRLYVLQRVRGIPDVNYTPALLLAAPGAPPGVEDELDMTYCTLRGVSPIHLEYMRNMGVAASMGISLLSENSLWGMIIGHHASPRLMSAELRALGDVVGQLMSALIQQVTETEHLARRLSRTHAVTGLRQRLESPETLAGGLSRHAPLVLDLMDATGAFISLGAATHCIGVTPPVEKAAEIVGALRKLHAEDIVGVSDAGRPGGISAACADTASGVLVMPIINNPGDAIAWFRPELVRTVHWAGDPRKLPSVVAGRLSPRHSFAAWRQEVRGSSVPWTAVDLETARELRRVITVLLLGQARAQLTHLSTYDPLTSLVNRQTVKAHLEQRRHDGSGLTDSVLFLDLDRFKAINESFGHAAGDQVLVEFAARLRRLAPEGALAGRLGNDEFVILWPGGGRLQAETLAATLRPALGAPYLLNDQSHQLNVSIGIACSGIDGLGDLLIEAEEAMHAAKRAGGDTVVVFDASMHATALTAMRLEQDLFLAVQNNEIEIHYQPVSAVPGRGLIGFEALARWRHPQRGWVPPGEFIPLAEETGLIVKVGAWVLTGAVRQIAAWRREHGDVSMSVNVSARQLMTGSLSALLANVLAAENVEPAAVVIEVTESALMHEAAVRELHLVRELGVKVSVDDFGTGYSSLSHLQKLPVDIVKIDRGFVTPLGSSRRADGLFARIVDLAHTLELRAVAEGCETEEQWGVIEAAGCDAIQGWLVAPALEAAKASAFLAAGRGQAPIAG